MHECKKNLLIKILIPVLIAGASVTAYRILSVEAQDTAKPVIVSENSSLLPSIDDKPLEILNKKVYGNLQGISGNYGFIGENEVLVGIGMNKEEFYKKYTKDTKDMSDQELENAWNDIYGSLYKLNLLTLEKTPLNINAKSLISDLSPNGQKVNYYDNDKYNIYDLKNNSKVIYDNKGKSEGPNGEGVWSKDENCFISFINDGDLKVYNQKNNSTKELKIKTKDLWISHTTDFYSEDGENIYFMGEQPKGKSGKEYNIQRQGIFKVNSNTNSIEEVCILPYVDRGSNDNSKYSGFPGDYKVLGKGSRILFDGSINGEEATYIYDVASKKFYKVIPHTFKSKEGSYGIFNWVSPDETKVVYMAPDSEVSEKTKWNLYASKISGNTITSRICIAKDFNVNDLANGISWSDDSKKVLFFNGTNQSQKNGFNFFDKNEINIVTFI